VNASKNEPRGLDELYEEVVVVVQAEDEEQTLVIFPEFMIYPRFGMGR
jgi:hypothetical protein